MEAFRDAKDAQASAYSAQQVGSWLRHIRLPQRYARCADAPNTFPKTPEALRTLFRAQITSFPYENLSVHYSRTHMVDIRPHVLYEKMMGPDANGRGGYCMELSIFFHHMLRGLGFLVYMTGVRNRTRTDGVPGGEYQGWTHINNIIHLPCGSKFSADVAFGGDGPTWPLAMDGAATAMPNLGAQEVRLLHDVIPKQRLREPHLWVYQYRNGPDREWNSFYSFSELEFFQEDFEVQNWWTAAKTLHRWTVIVVRFLREGEPLRFPRGDGWRTDPSDIDVVGKVMLIDGVVKVNMGGRTEVVHSFDSEDQRRQALWEYFGIHMPQDEADLIRGWDMALGQ